MNNRSFIKMLLLDTKEGIKKNLGYILLIAGFLFSEKAKLEIIFTQELQEKNIGIFDFVIFLLKGMVTYIPAKDAIFDISIEWLLIQIIPVLIVVSYIKRELYQLNFQTIIKTGSRKIWWNEKCAWICEVVFAFYIGIYMFGFLCYFQNDKMVNYDFWRDTYGLMLDNCTTVEWVNNLLIVPVLNSIFITLCFALLTVIINESASIILCIVYNVITMYYTSSFLLSNNTMLLRSTISIYGELNITNCRYVYIILTVAIVILGNIYIENCDLKDIMKDRGM